ncbi:MAG: hypothetical protein VB934_02195 [Polyangiaceae bacterium]
MEIFRPSLVMGLVLMVGCHVITGLDDVVPCEGNCEAQASSASGAMSSSGGNAGSGAMSGSGAASGSGAMSGSAGAGGVASAGGMECAGAGGSGAAPGCWKEFAMKDIPSDTPAAVFENCIVGICTECDFTDKTVPWCDSDTPECMSCDACKPKLGITNDCWECVKMNCPREAKACDCTLSI